MQLRRSCFLQLPWSPENGLSTRVRRESLRVACTLLLAIVALVPALPTSQDLVPFSSSCTGTCTASLCTHTFLGPTKKTKGRDQGIAPSTSMARSKTPPRPLREALRIRMEESGWERDYLFGRSSSLRSSEKVHGEARSGSESLSLSLSVSNGRVMGFGDKQPGMQPYWYGADTTRQRSLSSPWGPGANQNRDRSRSRFRFRP
jgi:hypothetical protein